MKRIRLLLSAGLLIGIVAIAAGCGGAEDDSSASSSTSPAPPLKNPPVPPGNEPGAENPPIDPTKPSFFELSFDGKVDAAKASDNSVNISAVGTNGDGSFLYFATDSKINEIYALDAATMTKVTPRFTRARILKTGRAPGPDGFVDLARTDPTTKAAIDSTKTIKIIAASTDKAVAIVTGVDTLKGGILQLKADDVIGSWGSTNASLHTGVDNKEISALTMLQDKTLIFVNESGANGSHIVFSDLAYNDLMKDPVTGTFPALPTAVAGPKGAPGPALGAGISAAATSQAGDLYLAAAGTVSKFPQPVDLAGGTFSMTTNKVLEAADLTFDGSTTANNKITDLAVVDGYVLVGLASSGAKTGGLALIKPDGTKIRPSHEGWGVKHIAVSQNKKTALISTDKGLLFFYYGSLTPIENANVNALTAAAITDQVPVGFLNPAAKSPDLDFTHTKVGAVHLGQAWYVATDNAGIYKITMTEKQK